MLNIYIDADACPVKQEVYRVARRYNLKVIVVSNTWMRIPDQQDIVLEVVTGDLDAADDWINEHIEQDDIVITADIPLASRCVKNKSFAISPRGKLFTDANVGEAVATRDLMSKLRSAGEITGGPPPLKDSDRSEFLQQLDNVIQQVKRKNLP